MKIFVVFIVILTVSSVISIENAFAEEEILILVDNDVRKVYYTGENITSIFFDPKSASVIFETGENAKLDVKAPQVYKYGEQLFILRNGEEVIPKIDIDDCFYYVTFTTQNPEKIELIFSHWPEATEVVENCETFTVPPLKQIQLGTLPEEIQCYSGKVLIFKHSDKSPACVKPESQQKLIERGWAVSEPESKVSSQDTNSEHGTPPLQIKVVGEKQVRRGTTQTIEIQVVRGSIPIDGVRVFIDIEDYGEDIIKEFKGYTNSQGYFVFSWEIPQSFDDVETLLAIIDVTDGISSKTELFKFQVYCLPGEKNCKTKGN